MNPSEPLLVSTERGIYCPDGDFFIDPWQPVERAVITHAHSDHARWGCGAYLCASPGRELLRLRVGDDAPIDSARYGETRVIRGVRVSLHPAGHILGSAQVRVERAGEVWVVSGDYKTERDIASGAFELVACHVFITESTFGLPIFRWRDQGDVMSEINSWWRENVAKGCASIIYAYALGKAQRVLAGVDSGIGPIFAHGSVMRFLDAYRAEGVPLPNVRYAGQESAGAARGRGLIVAPPSADSAGWLKKFGDVRTSFASGWMALRRMRKSRSVDRGFVLSDHVDWPALLAAIDATGAERVGVTHGYCDAVVRYLREEKSRDAWVVPTRFSDTEEQGEE